MNEAARTQIQLAEELAYEIAQNIPGVDDLIVLDSLACAGLALVKVDKNVASEAYHQART